MEDRLSSLFFLTEEEKGAAAAAIAAAPGARASGARAGLAAWCAQGCVAAAGVAVAPAGELYPV